MIEPEPGGCGVNPAREAELKARGWERRAVADEPRLSEAVEAYRELGFEVLLEPLDPSVKGEGGCTSCFEAGGRAGRLKVIYTRRLPGGGGRRT